MRQERDKWDMVTALRPYPEYKDSGVPWLGQIPGHWQLRKLRQCGAIVGGLTPPMNEPAFWGGSIPWVTPKDMKRFLIRDSLDRVTNAAIENTALRRIPTGAILLVVRGMILARRVPIAVAVVSTTINQDMKALIPSPGVSGSFLARVLDSARDALAPLIDEAGHGTRRLPTERWRDLLVPVPPVTEQDAIADFLANPDLSVARQIRSKERLLWLLNEQKQAIIHRAVTRGLDPNVRLKPSGIEWLGDVPMHWKPKRFKFVATVSSGQIDPRESPWRDHRLIAPNHIESGTGRLIASETASQQGAVSGKYPVAAGQVIYSKIRPNLRKATIAPTDCLCSADMYAISPDSSELRPGFLLLLLLSEPVTRYAVDSSMRVAMPKVNREALGDCWLWYPTLAEQDSILGEVSKQLEPLDVIVDKVRRETDFLREYRTRVVADVVLGKVDVRGVKLTTPDGAVAETQELEPGEGLESLESDEEEYREEPSDADE